MFELKLALKYLLPKKSALSRTVISLVSVVIISLVVWLVLVFLSVTSGLEQNWLNKLTTLNAPVRLTPTDAYYSSYYYLSDSVSSSSNFSFKTIKEKTLAVKTNPYNPSEDMEIPLFWPKPLQTKEGREIDIIKETYEVLNAKKQKEPSLVYEDFEMSGALMRLTLSRPASSIFADDEKLSYISQMSYLLTLNQNNPSFNKLLLEPSAHDLNNLLKQIDRSSDLGFPSNEGPFSPEVQENLSIFFHNIELKKVITSEGFAFPLALFPKDSSFQAYATFSNGRIEKLLLPQDSEAKEHSCLLPGSFQFETKGFVFTSKEGDKYPISSSASILSNDKIIFSADLNLKSLKEALTLEDVRLNIKGRIQNRSIQGEVNFFGLEIYNAKPIKADPNAGSLVTQFNQSRLDEHEDENIPKDKNSSKTKPAFWFQTEKGKLTIPSQNFHAFPVLLPKTLKDNGVLLGDLGYLAFASQTPTSTQEHRLTIYAAGFYDPGILPIGTRCILVPEEVLRSISSSNLALEGLSNNGLFVWFNDLKKADSIKADLTKMLDEKGLSKYWKINTYKEYEFSKDLMQQFQSDRLILTLVAIIIIIVACSNIISLLMLLINDKKKEIAILQSMGASKTSIAFIFGFCGFTMGMLSSLIGTAAALFTLKHLDVLVNFLSLIQGHNAFNVAFFGNKLPNILSMDALTFVLIATPIIALTAGLIPAIKACKLHPSSILRGD